MSSSETHSHRILAALLCLLFLVLSFPQALASDEERDTVRVGFFAFDGYHTIDENGVRGGYGYEFLRLLSRYWNVDYEYVGYENSWEDMLSMLESGQIDLVTSARITPERVAKFAISKPIGQSSAMLTVDSENHALVSGDYASYDGIRIGLLKGNSRNDDLKSFALEAGFSYSPVYFDLHTELEEALHSGQIDAAVTSTLRQPSNERVLDYFAVEQFYVLLRKEDTALLNKLNCAIDQLNAVEGDWQNTLNNKYYFHWEERDLSFTPEEQALIQQYVSGEKSLTVSVCTDKKPYAYTENGKANGILLDYFDALARYVGVPYTVAVAADRTEYNQWCSHENVANVFLDGRFSSMQQAEELGKALSAPYVTMKLAMVTRRDFDGQIGTLAVSGEQGLFGIEDGLAPNAQRLSVASREEAMQAVLAGRADATFVYLYTAQQFVNHDERGLLTYTMLEEPTYDYHVVFASNISHTLAGIFTKAIYAMPAGTFENIASEYTSYRAQDVDLSTWVKIHPLPTLAVGAALLLMIFLALQLIERQKAFRREKERSAQLQELAALADSASQAKTMFLNNMSHDIRTPMNAIIGFTSLAASHLDDPDQVREDLQKISVSSEHLLSLINDVLDMSRIESSKVKINEQPMRLPDLLRDIRTILQSNVADKQLDFIIDTKDVRDESIIADKLRLNQVLLNILSNGVKFNKPGGLLSLRVSQLNSAPAGRAAYRFTVRDTGIGMKKDFVDHIFDAFAREETATVSGIPGTGLGMTITKSLVDMMGGSIQVESQEGAGTEITVTLSFKLGPKSALCDEQASPDAVDFTGKTVLLVEDNPLNQEIATSLLKEIGLTVKTADDGSVAVERMKQARRGQYDLILMDIQMPLMDGYEATRLIRALPDAAIAATPIVAMTANAFASDEEKALSCGMNGYLTKPVHIRQIAEALTRVLADTEKQ